MDCKRVFAHRANNVSMCRTLHCMLLTNNVVQSDAKMQVLHAYTS